nr:MAG TPA: Protein of unknown function (DUF2634) [Caudoviricetes sp.]
MNTIKNIKFDYETNTFIPDIETDNVNDVKQWVELYIKVEKDKYKIYDENFGMDFSDIVGYRLPRSVQVSEIIRRLKRGIINGCDNVTDVRDFKFDKGKFTFTLITDLGEEVLLIV